MMSEPSVAVITGGARRVGLAISQSLVADGWRVIITYRTSAQSAREFVERLADDSSGRPRVVAVQADLEDPASTIDAVASAVSRFGRLDLLVNNASIYEPDPPTPDSQFAKRVWTVNVDAPVRLVEQFGEDLRSSRGHVVNMLDILAEKPWPKYATYCGTKAAMWNRTLTMARSLAPEVTVNGIAPGVVDWPDDMPAAERETYLAKVPLARAGTPADVARLVKFLATEGTYITGQIIRLDGGRSIVG